VPFSLGVYDALTEGGGRFGLKHCGYHALNSLRIEKAYREWAHDIGPDDTPLEAGLAFTCAWNKPDGFIGQEALLAARGVPVKRRLVQFQLEDPEPLLYHYEPILRDGRRVGFITSAMYGHTLGAAVGLGYVADTEAVTESFISSGRFEILIGNRTIAARASLRPMYDAKGSRIRS
jgi:glycine cleavage system aminomethyltransferase T